MAKGPEGPAVFGALVVAAAALAFMSWLIVKLFEEGVLNMPLFGWILAGVGLVVVVAGVIDRFWDPFNK